MTIKKNYKRVNIMDKAFVEQMQKKIEKQVYVNGPQNARPAFTQKPN